MTPFLSYILKLSISLSLVCLFYQLVLRKLTFYNWNRWYLLVYTILSFIIPFVDISPVIQNTPLSTTEVFNWFPGIKESTPLHHVSQQRASFTTGSFLVTLFAIGMTIMATRLCIQFLSFRRMLKRSKRLYEYSANVYEVNEAIIPFSFGNSIFINTSLHHEQELKEILLHEFIHVRQKHSVDIIWSEIIVMLNWFNPFAWWIRKAVRQNLEFIADHQVISSGTNRKEYQYLLLKVIGNNQFSIASQFNFSSLKKRIAMMNKMKTAKLHMLRFLFILPLLAVLLLSFRKYQLDNRSGIREQLRIQTDTIPTVAPKLFQNKKGNYVIIDGKTDPVIIILDKTKTELKRIALSEWNADADKYEDQYGELPPPPPPPAPVKPGLPPAPPPAPIIAGNNEGLSRICQEWEITSTKAWIKLRDGKTENYDLTKPEEKAIFEKKYGKLIDTNERIQLADGAVAVRPIVNGEAVIAPVALAEGVNLPATVVSPAAISTNIPSVYPVVAVGVNGRTVVAPVAAIAGIPSNDPYGYAITGKEDIIITITNKTTREQLEDFKKQMKEKDVELSFDEVEYNSKGELTNISGTMKTSNGHSNFVASDFTRLMLAMVRKDGKTYFKVSVRDGHEVI